MTKINVNIISQVLRVGEFDPDANLNLISKLLHQGQEEMKNFTRRNMGTISSASRTLNSILTNVNSTVIL